MELRLTLGVYGFIALAYGDTLRHLMSAESSLEIPGKGLSLFAILPNLFFTANAGL